MFKLIQKYYLFVLQSDCNKFAHCVVDTVFTTVFMFCKFDFELSNVTTTQQHNTDTGGLQDKATCLWIMRCWWSSYLRRDCRTRSRTVPSQTKHTPRGCLPTLAKYSSKLLSLLITWSALHEHEHSSHSCEWVLLSVFSAMQTQGSILSTN